jgi:hydroxymethylpyrimidine/phosphomethylpyrimidine kinase
MLASAETVSIVAQTLKIQRVPIIVLDPVGILLLFCYTPL